MPKVGKKQFSYTKAGKKAAKAYAKESGQSVEKYYGGGGVDPFSFKNPESVVVERAVEEIEEQNDIPTTNAMDRSQTSQVGNEVGTGKYKEGGKVDRITKKAVEKIAKKVLKGKGKDVTDVVKKVESERKAEAMREAYRRGLSGKKGWS